MRTLFYYPYDPVEIFRRELNFVSTFFDGPTTSHHSYVLFPCQLKLSFSFTYSLINTWTLHQTEISLDAIALGVIWSLAQNFRTKQIFISCHSHAQHLGGGGGPVEVLYRNFGWAPGFRTRQEGHRLQSEGRQHWRGAGIIVAVTAPL